MMNLDTTQFKEKGYITALPVLTPDEIEHGQQLYRRLAALIPSGHTTLAIDWWHQVDRELYDLCTHPEILGYVEQILGADFYLWGSQFFAKEAGENATVPWHQDAYYWPLEPHRAVTVWLAVEDSFAENGAMMVIPGTHTQRMRHKEVDRDTDVLNLETCDDQFRLSDAVTLCLNAGECSLHDDNIVHGSRGNVSDRIRCGLTIRFSAGESKCDTSVWPFFKAYWVRGEDRWGHNPVSRPPTELLTEFTSVTPRTGQS